MDARIILFIVVLTANLASGQISLQRNFNLELAEKDSLKSQNLEQSLAAFLTEAQHGSYSNEYVDSVHLKEYAFFFHRLAGIGKDDNPDFNDPIILKSYSSDLETYNITVAFTGIRDDVPFVYQVTEFKAVPYEEHYRFYSPFKERTEHFSAKIFGDVTYHFSGAINEDKAREFSSLKAELSELTNTENSPLAYYCFKDLDELLRAYGFLYSVRQCNFLCYDLGFTDSEGRIYVTGTNNENYSFGYISDYLNENLPNKATIYKPFVQGIATYYGGYGLSNDGMEDLKQQFRDELKRNPEIDFLGEFKKGRKSSINRHFSFYVMCAFICEEVMNTKGFGDVLKLVHSGAEGESYFTNLDEVLNIDEDNFHEAIVRLISEPSKAPTSRG